MVTMIDYLEKLNRKERYFLIGLALGKPKFKLAETFLTKLNREFHTAIPDTAFVAMDYHLNWIFAAATLAFQRPALKNNIYTNEYDNEGKFIEGTQEDIDLLVAYEDNSGMNHLIMLEAKGVTSYDNAQFIHKMNRLRTIFGENGNRFEKVRPYFGLISPRESKGLNFDCCPSWLKVEGKIPWLEMDIPERLVLFGCDEQGKPNKKRDFWTVKPK